MKRAALVLTLGVVLAACATMQSRSHDLVRSDWKTVDGIRVA